MSKPKFYTDKNKKVKRISKRRVHTGTLSKGTIYLNPKHFSKKTTRETEILGIPVKKETEKTHISPVPSEISEKKDLIIKGKTKRPFSDDSASLGKSEETKSKFSKEEKKTD